MSTNDSRGHMPGGKWEFDAEVTACFPDMLSRSIPQLEEMRSLCHQMALRFIRPYGTVLDLGCSDGGAISGIREGADWRSSVRFYGCDCSAPMVEAARKKFAGDPMVYVQQLDLRKSYPDVSVASVTLSVLTLQFIPVNYRQRILRTAYERTAKGGLFLLVEKLLADGPELGDAQTAIYHGLKERNGYSRDAIEAKAEALEGVLVPLTAEANMRLLRSAGYGEVDCFWRWGPFAAFAAVKT